MHQRVLLVEDNEILAAGVSALLVEEGFEVEVVGQGREVIGMIADHHPDVVVLDVSLPDVDGILVADAIRRFWPELPIIFTSGYDHQYAGLPEALSHPNTAMLMKPYEIQWLVDAIERMTRK